MTKAADLLLSLTFGAMGGIIAAVVQEIIRQRREKIESARQRLLRSAGVRK